MRGEGGRLAEYCRASQDGDTPLHTATLGDQAAIVELLLAAGVDKEAKNLVSGEGRL